MDGPGGMSGDADAHLRRALERQRAAARREPCPSLAARRASLRLLSSLLREHAQTLQRAVDSDFGTRAWSETVLAELLPVLDALTYSGRHLAAWMRPRRRSVSPRLWPGAAWVRPVPLGCVGIASPWNYPILLSLMPLVDALAAGNRVMLKPSEQTPATADALARLLGQRFDPEQLKVVVGDVQQARAFSRLPFDHLLFTGSTQVGRSVATTAASGLVPVTLELGGKSPVIVCADALSGRRRLERTAHSIAVGKFFNAGQTCLAPDYVLAPRERALDLATAIAAAAARLYPTILDNPDYTAVISHVHLDRLAAMLSATRCRRVFRHPQDRPDRQDALRGARKMPPLVLFDPDPESPAMGEEIFGPLLPVIPYDSLAEAVACVNARPTPLAFYCYSNELSVQHHLEHAVRCGGMTINNTILHGALPSLPLSGLGASGMGSYHGREGFLRLSHLRGIYRSGPVSGFTWMSPPHGRASRWLLDLMLRR